MKVQAPTWDKTFDGLLDRAWRRDAVTRFAEIDRSEEEEHTPPCWGKSYDADDDRCQTCGRRLSCKADYQEKYGSRVPIRRTTYATARPAAATSSSTGPARTSAAPSDPHAGCAGVQPEEGESHAERLGKNVLAAIIRAIAYEVLEFFKRYHF